jgi:glycosyltransferase 2 family protein
VLLVVLLFGWMIRPIQRNWHVPEIRDTILSTNWLQFLAAAMMFSLFLFIFRALSWRRILAGLGHRLPVFAAGRIWSFSELARYVPGMIWQVLGRIYLTRPYGVGATTSSASQVLEVSLFVLANILVALTGLLAAGIRQIPPDQRQWVFLVMALVPLLLALLHPAIFYRVLNGLLGRIGQPLIEARLPKRQLTALLGWMVVGLLWQSLAIWLLTRSTLHLPIEKWYVLAGAYCLAWTVGFCFGFLAPGGIGVREAVFIGTMQFVLPPDWVAANLQFDPEHYRVFLGFLGVLLRLWTIVGELTMAGLMYLADAYGRPSTR